MAQKIEISKVLSDKKYRESLSDQQLAQVLEEVKKLTRGLGSHKVESDPASFAARLSGGVWKPAKHLKLISHYLAELEARKRRFLVISAPPRHGKSLITDVWFPVWWLTRNPKARIILVGYGESFARDWGAKVRDLIIEHSEELNLVVDKDHNAADDWQLTAGGGMICVGVGGSLVGRGADLLIVDDPIKNAEEANSEVYRERMWNWWQVAAFTRLQPNAVAVVMCTRWHTDDLLGRIIANDEKKMWHELRIPAIAEENDVLGRSVGEPLWPEHFTDDPDYSIRMGSMSPYWWNAQYQGRPVPESGGKIERDWFKFYDNDSKNIEYIIKNADQMIQSWDPAVKDKKTSDWWVGQVWARIGANFYLIAQVRDHLNLAKAQDAMKLWTLLYPKAVAKVIEDSAMGPAIKQTLHNSVPGIIPITAEGSKVSRVDAITPILRSGNVYLPEDARGVKPKWVWTLIEECASFPNGANDDQVDALSQAISFMSPASWQQAKAKARSLQAPEKTPAQQQAEVFNEWKKKMLAAADKRFGKRPNRLRQLC